MNDSPELDPISLALNEALSRLAPTPDDVDAIVALLALAARRACAAGEDLAAFLARASGAFVDAHGPLPEPERWLLGAAAKGLH